MTGRRVVVVGAGNAGLCAAISAAESGAAVTLLEFAPEPERGGNSAYTAGGMRVVYRGTEDLEELIPGLGGNGYPPSDFGTYSAEDFFADMARMTEYRCDPDLVSVLVEQSLPTLKWMRSHGVRFVPMYGRQAFKQDGQFKFWGGLTVEVNGGGPGLVDALFAAAERLGVEVLYQHRAVQLQVERRRVTGVIAAHDGNRVALPAEAVTLASGGFEANVEWRAKYLGPGWDLAKTRGTRFNIGDGIRIALEVGAVPWGNWSGCHAVLWDLNAPDYGTLSVGDGFQKHSYPFGILVNRAGQRFVDEGADFRNYTYATYGRRVLEQTGQSAWQIFDAKVSHLLRDEYRIREVTKLTANTLADLAGKLDGIDETAFLRSIEVFNAAIDESVPFDPTIKDGRCTKDLPIPKSNWANPIDTPPFEAYAVTCGITFTFGGLRINTTGEVIDVSGAPIPGLYACGEIVGGLFYFNYPGGAGLTAGAVFGRTAGRAAAGAGGTKA